MATTTKTTTPTTGCRTRQSPPPATADHSVAWHILFEEDGQITVDAPRSLAGADARATLLPTGGELALYLADPEAAIAALCARTHAPLLLGMLAFRVLFTGTDYAST